MKTNPNLSQEEADGIMKYLTETVAKAQGIPIDEAKKRVVNLFESGILDGGSPDDPLTQMRIVSFLQKPSTDSGKTIAPYEVKTVHGAYKVWNNTGSGWITKPISDRTIAQEICDDFNRMANKDYSPIGMPDFS